MSAELTMPVSKLSAYLLFFFIQFFIPLEKINAQNLGVNTTNPQASLDVRGNMRMGGVNNFLSYDSLSARIGWSNSRLYVPSNQALIKHSSSSPEGLYYNNSALEYRNQTGNPVFFTNWNSAYGYFAGSLGIGTLNPAARLHIWSGNSGVIPNFTNLIVEASGENKIQFNTADGFESAFLFQKPSQILGGGIFYNSPSAPDGFIFKANNAPRMYVANNGNVGIGRYPQTRLHIFDGESGYSGGYFPGITFEGNGTRIFDVVTPPSAESGILFGYGSNYPKAGGIIFNNPATPNGLQFFANGAQTAMVINNIGYVGMGVGNLNPAFMLDVRGRIRLRSGGNNFTSAGIWFNNSANGEAAFIGMEDDTHVGLYGNNSAGWKFGMNTGTGALRVNGSEGEAGKVITSNGNAAPEWKSPTKYLYDNTVMKKQNSGLIMNSASAPTTIPDLSHTFTVPGNAKVLVSIALDVGQPSCFLCGNGIMEVELQLNGNYVTRFREGLDNGNYKIVKTEFIIDVGPGTHTISLVARPAVPGVSVDYVGTGGIYTSTATYIIIAE